MTSNREWQQVCEVYAERIGAELLFVNPDSFGICTADGELLHVYADELYEILRKEKANAREVR